MRRKIVGVLFKCFWCYAILHGMFMFAVINASHTFYTGTTSVPIDKNNPSSRKRKTNALNTTSNPEDKRKIIGDTFMKVKSIKIPSILLYFLQCLSYSLWVKAVHHLYRNLCFGAGLVNTEFQQVEFSLGPSVGKENSYKIADLCLANVRGLIL